MNIKYFDRYPLILMTSWNTSDFSNMKMISNIWITIYTLFSCFLILARPVVTGFNRVLDYCTTQGIFHEINENCKRLMMVERITNKKYPKYNIFEIWEVGQNIWETLYKNLNESFSNDKKICVANIDYHIAYTHFKNVKKSLTFGGSWLLGWLNSYQMKLIPTLIIAIL
jgi:hypothetical protein